MIGSSSKDDVVADTEAAQNIKIENVACNEIQISENVICKTPIDPHKSSGFMKSNKVDGNETQALGSIDESEYMYSSDIKTAISNWNDLSPGESEQYRVTLKTSNATPKGVHESDAIDAGYAKSIATRSQDQSARPESKGCCVLL